MNNSLNIPEIDQEQALNLLKFGIRSNQNTFLFGKKGVGKTHIALQAIKECGFKVNYINLSVIERSDLAGYPDIHARGDTIKFKAPNFLPQLNDNSKANTILLFDEVDKCLPETTAPLLEILQFKKINGAPINAICSILTGNLPNEHTYSNQISSALLDRGSKYILTFSFEKWLDWAKENQINDLILGFLTHNQQYACGDILENCYASPSPRGWAQASDALKSAKHQKLIDLDTTTQLVSSFVGNEVGIRFRMWYEYFRQFEGIIHSIIDGGKINFDFYKLEPSSQLIFVISLCFYTKTKSLENKSKNKHQPLENLVKFFVKNNVDIELQLMGLSNSFTFDMIAKNKLYECVSFFDLFSKINEKIRK